MARNLTSRILGYGVRLGDALASIIYPEVCRVCGGPVGSLRDGVVCSGCWESFERDRPGEEICFKCGVSMTRRSGPYAPARIDCGRCLELDFDIARACGPYEGALKECVLRLKNQPHFPARLKAKAIEVLREIEASGTIDSILPAPLHPERLSERTYNQAEVIAEALAEASGIPVDRSSLIRVRATRRHRAGMSPLERARSLKQAFRVRAPRLIENRSILLVDDVMTTGSTAHEISLVLRAAGAARVSVLALARAAEGQRK